MKSDDRFSMIAGGIAFLVTAALFTLTHLDGSLSLGRAPAPERSRERVSIVEAPRVEPAAEPASVAEVVASEPEVVAAVNRSRPRPTDVAGTLSAAASFPRSPAPADVLRLLALSGPDAPDTADVLVRRDADGRMVVASGTHRAYATLVDRFEALDPSALDTPQALRGELTRAIDHLLATPEVEVEPDMASNGVVWTFADPELAALDRDQRQLLLMGRDNAGIVRSRLADLRRGLAPEVLRAVEADASVEHEDPVILATAR